MKLRTDFPADVVQEREKVFEQMRELLIQNTLISIKEACRLQLGWLKRYPDDAVMLDVGEILGKSHDALLATEQEADPVFTSPDEHLQEVR